MWKRRRIMAFFGANAAFPLGCRFLLLGVLATSGQHSFALPQFGLDARHALWAWGDDTEGRLGLGGAVTNTLLPTPVDLPQPVSGLSVGASHVMALAGDGRVWVWGGNARGQLGQRPLRAQPLPQPVPGLFAMRAVAAGDHHSLALDSEGNVYSWGNGTSGQLGRGQATPFSWDWRPVRVPLPVRAEAISAGPGHSLAKGVDGSIWAWGALNGSAAPQPYARPVDWPLAQVPGPLAAVVGSVLSERHPAPGLTVEADGWPCAVSDARGRYRCTLPPGWQGSLVASTADGRHARQVIRLDKAERRFDLALARPTVSDSRLLPAAASAPALVNPANPDAPTAQPARSPPRAPAGAPARPSGEGLATIVTPVPPAARPEHSTLAQVNPTPPTQAGTSTVQTAATAPQSSPAQVVPLPPADVPAPRPIPSSRRYLITGRVLIDRHFSGNGLEGVALRAEGATCTVTDRRGEFTCQVPENWLGSLVPEKRNYRFSPSRLRFQELRADFPGQSFAATYEPE